jgi:hypothetical protein
MPLVNVQQSLKAGVLRDLMEFWKQSIPTFRKQQEVLMKTLPFTTIRNASYPFKESLPFPKLWNYGTPRSHRSFQDRVIQLNLVPYELTIDWSIWDEMDDQIRDLRQHVQMAVNRYGQLPDVLISEYFNGVASLNPDLALAYDGVNLFSTVDGDGLDRFGSTGGNIIVGSGLTVAGIIHDIARAQRRFLDFLDPTAKKPIYSPDEVKFSSLHIIGPNEANEVFQKASNSEFIKIDTTNNTSESNYIKGTFQYHLNPYLTDTSDWYVVVQHPYWKPFIYREPQSIESIVGDQSNSDRSREFKEAMFYTDIRSRLGIMFPGTIIKVNN